VKEEYRTPNGEGWAFVQIYVEDGEAEVTNVRVREGCRGKGWGANLMKQIIEDADREGVVLLLTSGLGYDTGLRARELVAWYVRLGFDAIAVGRTPGTTIMQRVPHPVSLTA
jgi:ribosomal protein S18 acetylase RimI-like enzyme